MSIIKKYTCVKQHDMKDCGAACLSTIAKKYGLKLQISKIREACGTDSYGTNAYGLVKAAEELGFSAKAIKGTREDLLKEFPKPAIANVLTEDNVQHYVVIHKITKTKVIIADPAKGIRKISFNEFAGMWTGVLIVLTPTYKFEKKNETKGTFTRFFKMLIPHKYLMINVFLMSLVLTIFGIIGSFYFKFLMDDIIPNGLEKTLHLVSIAFIGLYLLRIALEAIRSHLMIYLSQKLDIPLMLGYYNHVTKLPMKFFSNRQIGEITSRFQDAGAIKDAVSGATLTVMMDIIMVFVGGIILYSINTHLFFIALTMVVLYAILTWTFIKPFKKINRESMEQGSKISSYLIESLQGSETIKAFNSEEKVQYETEKRYVKGLRIGKKAGIIGNIQGSLKGIVEALGGLFILWYGSLQVIRGNITFGQLITFNALLAYFVGPLRNLVDLQGGLQQAMVAGERLSEIIDLEPEYEEDENKKYQMTKIKNEIKFENVDYRYGTRRKVLEELTLTIKKGESIAIIGESGSGKTTLAKLLLNFYNIEKGKITIDEIDLKDIDRKTLRDKIGYVPQEVFLFSGSIEENLKMGNQEIKYEEMIEVCKAAKVHEFIELIPKRYKGALVEGGRNLSGGQRQRLAIARALLKKPEIIILDEATSNLDANTEEALTNVLNTQYKEITKIIIAHRLSTIRQCEKIVVLDNGKIAEIGTHKELLSKKGNYYKLYTAQFPEAKGGM